MSDKPNEMDRAVAALELARAKFRALCEATHDLNSTEFDMLVDDEELVRQVRHQHACEPAKVIRIRMVL